jgi:glutathione synthase/RimK-type ligase-like ATP-grasp enzyme
VSTFHFTLRSIPEERVQQLFFATCERRPNVVADDLPLRDAFHELGIEVIARPWTSIIPGTDRIPILIRSTWDYQYRVAEFDRWLAAIAASGVPLFNPARTLRWNLDKIYLRTLEGRGVAVPESRWLDESSPATVERLLAETGWQEAVLKPRVSAGAHATRRLRRDTALSEADLAPVQAGGCLIQEFLPEIQDRGELSLVFLAGTFSHAACKRPQQGDFRVQEVHGGAAVSIEAPAACIAAAADVLARADHPWLYARVDLVETRRGPLLMELEMLEPELFFRFAPRAAHRLAQGVATHLARAAT